MNLLKRVFVFVTIALASIVALAGCAFEAKSDKFEIENDRIMYVGYEYDLAASLSEAELQKVVWSTDNEGVAKIENGKIIVLKEGSFNLCAVYNGERLVKHIVVHAPETYSITYVLNGGKGNDLITSYTEIDQELVLVEPTRLGYEFQGFYLNEEFSGEKVTKVHGEDKLDLVLYAKWNIINYPIAFVLNGGAAQGLPASRTVEEEIVLPEATQEGFEFAGWFDNAQLTGAPVTKLSKANLDIETLYAKYSKEMYSISYELNGAAAVANPTSYDIESSFQLLPVEKTHYEFLGWYNGTTKVTEIVPGMTGNLTLTAKFSPIAYPISFELDGGEAAGLPTSRTIESAEIVLPQAEKGGNEFLGWFENADFSGEPVEKLDASNLSITKLYAKFEVIEIQDDDPTHLYVGEGKPYATINAAMEAAQEGYTIILVAGNHEGGTISKKVKLQGPNAGINPNEETRKAEAIVSGDIVVAADGVVIDGIQITGNARIMTSASMDVDNLLITNVTCKGSTLNVTSADSNTAPLFLVAGANFTVSNVVVTNCRFDEYASGRPMIAFIEGVENLTIENNTFIGLYKNYNDGIKTNQTTRAAVSGEVSISHNHFENFQQYIIWFRSFGPGNYKLEGNTFKKIGITPGSHAAFNFIKYYGNASDELNVSIKYNEVETGFMFLRIDKDAQAEALAAAHTFTVQYNKMHDDCAGSYYVKNASLATVICDNNYWGTATPDEAKFMGVSEHTNDAASIDDVLTEEEAWFIGKLLVGEGKDYATLSEALAAAVDGDVIYVFPGTYAEEVTVNKSVTILGPNYGIHGHAERGPEAEFTMRMTVTGSNITLDGLKFSGAGNIVLKDVDGMLIDNIVMLASPIKPGSDGRGGQLVNTGAVSNLVVENSYFNVGNQYASGRDNIVFCDYTTNNLIIRNNYLCNELPYAAPAVYSEAVKVTMPAGIMILEGNEIRFTTDNFIVYYGSISSAVTKMIIQDNILGAFESTEYGTAGVALRNFPAGAQVDIIHNYFYHHNGNVIDFRYDQGSVATIMYNLFDINTAFKQTYAAGSQEFINNYYEKAQVTATSDYGVVKSAAELEQLYQEYLKSLDHISDTTLSYELNGGYTTEELPAVHVYGEATELPALYKEGYRFLGWTTEEESTNYITKIGSKVSDPELTLYAQFEFLCLTVGEGGEFATIQEALDAAKEFDVIQILPGAYAENALINTSYLRIIGANQGIAFDGIRGEESQVGTFTLAKGVHNVTLDGFEFTNIMGVELKGNSNISVLNSLFGVTPTADGQSMLKASGTINGLNVEGCSFITKKGRTHYRAIHLEGSGVYSKNINIEYNYFENDCASSVYIDCVKIADLTGDVNISHNSFNWAGNNWTVFVGGGSCSNGVTINFNDNQFADDKGTTQSGATFRNLKADTVVNVIGNSFSEVGGTVVQTNGGTAAHVTVKNNAFLNTSAKQAYNVTADNFVYENNYSYTETPEFSGTQKPTTGFDAETSEAALAGMVRHFVTYNCLPGAMLGFQFLSFVEGAEISLAQVQPTYTDYRFVAWYDNEALEGEPVTSLGAQDSDVVLYAKYEVLPVHTITYVMNEGELAGLPTQVKDDCVLDLSAEPSRFGCVFLGWTTEEGSTEYITKVTVTSDLTIYANWLEATLYTVTFETNGGSVRYASRDALIADFLKDYNKVMGTNWQKPADIGDNNFNPVSWHTFYEKELDSKTTVRDKWLWLAQYLWELSKRDLASNNCNNTGLKKLCEGGSYSGDDIYGLLYAFRAFLQGNTSRPGSSYTSVDFSIYENANGFWTMLSEAEPKVYQFVETDILPSCNLENYLFAGWYTNPEFTGDPVTQVSEDCTLYAKLVEEFPVTKIEITNKVEEIERYETLQLVWELTPANALVNAVTFESSNPDVISVDANGLITALNIGEATITITSASQYHHTDSMTVLVYAPGHFEVAYETNSYLKVGESIQLLGAYTDRNDTEQPIVWSSLDESIATVDQSGLVTAVAVGYAHIKVALEADPSVAYEFLVTVLDDELSEALQYVLEAHNSNVFTRYDLGIGAGKPAYYRDIYGNVSDIMFNETLTIDNKYYTDGTTGSNHGGLKSSVEFITVHYTGNMSQGSTAAANANYFSNLSADTSINYVTGNDGVFACLDDKYVAFHAGDGTGVPFEWYNTGVAYQEGDPLYPAWAVTKNAQDKFVFTLNGQETSIEIPDPAATITTNADNYSGSAKYMFASTYTDPKWFNDMGLAYKVVDGTYYMGKTWWCYTQVLEGRICSRGGNLNSVGIESAVNPESDLWYTWAKTAQLVAYLMNKYNLDITRVVGHHFFAAKDCPQPLLENDLEIWWEFIDMVKAEYAKITTFADYTFTMSVNEADASVVSALGRVTVPTYAQNVEYTVVIEHNGQQETITLGTAVNGVFAK